jgi:hypothetical protein
MFSGFLKAAFIYAVLATVFPIKRAGMQDDTDFYGNL